MKGVDMFFYKAISNQKVNENLKMLEGNMWENLSFQKKLSIFETIAYEFSSFYPELGNPNIKFIIMDDHFSGQESEEEIFINAKLIEDENHFEVLATCLHEIRHFYQNRACMMYQKEGVIHELFDSKEQIEAFIVNLERSSLFLTSNYIDSYDENKYEYGIQPVEYDADRFSFEFMEKFSDKFLSDEYDIINCKMANETFRNIQKMISNDKYNLFQFNRIYEINYKDNILDNRPYFKREERIAKKTLEMLERIDRLDDSKLFSLMNPCFLQKYDDKTKVELFNRYLANNDCKDKIEYLDDGYYFKGLLFNTKEYNIYKLVEPIFMEVAYQRIESIIKKNYDELKFGFEKEIKLNLEIEENKISKEKHPLYYRIQPYMLFRDMFITNEYFKLIRGIDAVYDTYNNYFSDFSTYIKKYDVNPIANKVEVLTGKKFQDVYQQIINKMKNNIEKRKTSK